MGHRAFSFGQCVKFEDGDSAMVGASVEEGSRLSKSVKVTSFSVFSVISEVTG